MFLLVIAILTGDDKKEVVTALLAAGSAANPVDSITGETMFDVLEVYDATEMLEILKHHEQGG